MSNKKVVLSKKRVLWKRIMAGVMTAAMVLSGSMTMQTDSSKVYAVEDAEALKANSIINWDGLPEITEEKVQTEAESGVDIQFTHPGIFANKENLDLMRQMIHEGYDPWFTAFEAFREDALASKDYENTNADRTHTYIGNADRQDANAAYMQSVMWWVTGDKDYYDNAVDIIRSYSESYDAEKFATEQDGGRGWSADIITTGMVINKLTFAAELLRYATTEQAYDNAWTDADTENFVKVLEMAYPLYDRTDKWMNQTAFTFQAMIASAVFQNDPDMYELVIERATVNDKAAYHFADASIKWQARLVETTANKEDLKNGTLTLETLDEPVIQWAEMGRDQPHALAGLSIMEGIVQTSYIQGTEVNENGQIVTDGSGTNLFEFLDHRLLKGANYYYQFNLGYDVTWYPLAKGNVSDYADCGTLIGGSDNAAGWWTDVSNAGRFTLGGSGVLYYHYLYEEGLSKNDPNFKYIAEAQELQDDTGGSGGAITNASLLLAPEAAKTGEPQGPPQKKEAAGYAANIAGSGRIQAMDHSGAYASKMPVTSTPSSEYYTDDLGTREVTNNNYKNDYIWFQDMDLGTNPLNTFMLTSASNSGQGTLFKVVLLDDVNVADWSAVTRAEIDSGEVVAEGYSGGTGWWSTYKTKLFPMTKSLSGKHSFAFLYLGSDNVYDLAANVDWMAFGNNYAYESNAVKDAPVKGDVTVDGDNAVLKNGSYFGWNAMNMDVGNSGLTMDIISEGVGKLHLYSGTPDGEHALVATYDVPFTGGAKMTVNVPGEHFDTIKGNQDIYYVYEGDTDLTVTSICSYYYKDNSIPTVEGEDFALVKAGEVTGKTEGDISYAEMKDGSIAFYRLNLSGDNLSFRVRTNGKAVITLTSGMDNNGNMTSEDVYRQFGILKMEIPNTNGAWASFQCDLTEVTNRSSNVYLMVTGADVDLDAIVSVGDNSPAEIRSYVYDKPVFSMEKDGAYTDYLLAGQDYKVTVDTFDFNNDAITTMVVLDQNYVSENGSIPMNIAQAGEYEALVVADDGSSWTLQNRKLVVVENIDQLIEKVGAYDTSKTYSQSSLKVYNEALDAAKALAGNGYTAELVEALKGVGDAVAALIMCIPTEEDGQIDYLTYSNFLKLSRYNSGAGGYSDVQETVKNEVYNLLDNAADTFIEYRHSQNNTAAYFMIDFTEGMGVKLNKFTLQSRQTFGSRTSGVLLEASTDGQSWVTISANGAANSNDLQTISIKPEYADVAFRYIRLYNPRVTASGANSFLSIAEFHIYGEVVETSGDDGAAMIAAQIAIEAAVKDYTMSQTEVATVDAAKEKVQEFINGLELGDVEATVITKPDSFVAPIAGTIDNVLGTNGVYSFNVELTQGEAEPVVVENLSVQIISIGCDTEAEEGVIDYIKEAASLKFIRFSNLEGGLSEDQAAILSAIPNLTDDDPNTHIEWRHSQNNTPAYFMIDFTEGKGVKLNQFTLQSRLGFGSRTNGVLLEASNDGETWVTISSKGAANNDKMQVIAISDEYADVAFRYIRLYNPRVNESGANSFLSIAEFHLFGEIVDVEEIPDEHQHTFSAEWASDDTYHWHAATCEHTEETLDKAEHTSSDWIVDAAATTQAAGSRHKECTVCEKVLVTEEIPQLPGEVTSGIAGTVKSYSSDSTVDNTTTIQLLDVSGNVIAQTTVAEAEGSYTLSDVSAGDYTVQVSKEDHVTREYSVTVGTEMVTLNVEVWLLGDVNGDGDVTVKDKKVIFNHMEGTSTLTDYAFAVGDVDGNGDIVAKDKKMIYNHIEGNSLLW